MEEKRDEKEAQEQPEKKKPSKKLIIMIAAGLVVFLIVAGVAGYFFLLAPKGKAGDGKHAGAKTEEASKGQGEKKGEGGGKEGEGPGTGNMKPLEPFIVNLTDAQGGRYLKVVMQLEMEDPGLAEEINSKIPQIRDEMITILSSKSFDDLSTVPGKRALKRSILENVNKFLTTGKVINVYFSEFVIQ